MRACDRRTRTPVRIGLFEKRRVLLMRKRLCWRVLPILCLLYLLAGCPERPQCAVDSDCLAAGVCTEARCNAGVCEIATIEDCCGNELCEGPDENTCTCPTDCGPCAGQVTFAAADGEEVDARYLYRRCTAANVCAVLFDVEAQVYRNELHELSSSGLVFRVVVGYPVPLAVNKDSVVVEIELVQRDDKRVRSPITVTSALLLDDALLFGRTINNFELRAPGDRLEIVIPILGGVALAEEQNRLAVRLYFEYPYLAEKQRTNDGLLVYDSYGRPVMETIQDDIVKSSLEVALGQPVTLVNRRVAQASEIAAGPPDDVGAPELELEPAPEPEPPGQ